MKKTCAEEDKDHEVSSQSNQVNKAKKKVRNSQENDKNEEFESTSSTGMPKEVIEGIHRAIRNAVAFFKDNGQSFEMGIDRVDLLAPDNEFLTDDEAEEVMFKGNQGAGNSFGENNNATMSRNDDDNAVTEEYNSEKAEESEPSTDGECSGSEDEREDEQKQKSNQPVIFDKDEIIDAAVAKFKVEFLKKGFMETNKLIDRQVNKRNRSRSRDRQGGSNSKKSDTRHGPQAYRDRTGNETVNQKVKVLNKMMSQASALELTVYKNAVENQINKRNSSSSEDNKMDTSEETGISDESNEQIVDSDLLINDFIAEARERTAYEKPLRDRDTAFARVETYSRERADRPSTSGYIDRRAMDRRHGGGKQSHRDMEEDPEDIADNLIRSAERGKARCHELPGELCDFELSHEKNTYPDLDIRREFVHSAMVDESYQLVGSHLDQAMQDRIIRGEYVDFARLVPKDRVLTADDNRYEMIVRDGKTFWTPASSIESVSISNFNRWEQAFRVYSDVYMRAYPYRASELVQYSHLIHTASQSYTWENVYMYDKDFRLHLERHPSRSWAIILQQAWAVRLKD